MKSVILASLVTVMTCITSLACGDDDGMEQYYKDAQFKGTRGVGESVVTLIELKTTCEILTVLDFQTTTEDFRKDSLTRYEEDNPKKVEEWMTKFNPAKNSYWSDPRRDRAGLIIWGILMPTTGSDGPPDYWGRDHYYWEPSDTAYPPRTFCRYIAGLEEPPNSDQVAQRDYDKYMDELLRETYIDGGAQYYLESYIGNRTHLRKYYDDILADMENLRAPVSQTEFLTACELYERMGFQFDEDVDDLEGSFWRQEEVRERLNNFHPTYDEPITVGLSDAQTQSLRAASIIMSIQNPRGIFLLGDAVPIDTQKALCEYVAKTATLAPDPALRPTFTPSPVPTAPPRHARSTNVYTNGGTNRNDCAYSYSHVYTHTGYRS